MLRWTTGIPYLFLRTQTLWYIGWLVALFFIHAKIDSFVHSLIKVFIPPSPPPLPPIFREELDEVKEDLAVSEEGSLKLSEEVKQLKEEIHESKMKLIEMNSLQETVKRLKKQLQASEEKCCDLQTSTVSQEQNLKTMKLTHEQQVRACLDQKCVIINKQGGVVMGVVNISFTYHCHHV